MIHGELVVRRSRLAEVILQPGGTGRGAAGSDRLQDRILGRKRGRPDGLPEGRDGSVDAGAQAEGMASWVGVDDEGAIAFSDRRAEDGRAQFDGPGRGWLQLIDGEIEMELLRRAVRPDWALVPVDALERQLETRFIEVYLAPVRVGHVDAAVEQLTVEGGQADRIGAVEDHRT